VRASHSRQVDLQPRDNASLLSTAQSNLVYQSLAVNDQQGQRPSGKHINGRLPIFACNQHRHRVKLVGPIWDHVEVITVVWGQLVDTDNIANTVLPVQLTIT